MMVLINSILTTTAVIAESFDAEERKIIGSWLNKLVKKVAKSSWKDRQDNKAYLTSYITLIWGFYTTISRMCIVRTIQIYVTKEWEYQIELSNGLYFIELTKGSTIKRAKIIKK